MKNKTSLSLWLRFTLAVVLVSGIVSILTGFLVYKKIQENNRFVTENELQLINKLKANSVKDWRKIRLTQANSLSNDTLLGNAINSWLFETDLTKRRHYKDLIKNRLLLLVEQSGYNSVSLAAINGDVFFGALSGGPKSLPAEEQQAINAAIETAMPVSLGIRVDDQFSYPFFSVVTPIYFNNAPIALIWLVNDVRKDLYPILENNPSANDTLETILFSAGDNKVTLLNPVSFTDKLDSEYINFIPISNHEAVVARAASGMRGIHYGKDYAGQDVISFVSAVSGSPWLLLTKVNVSKSLNTINKELISIAIPVLLGMLCIWFSLAFLQYSAWRRERHLNKGLELEVQLDPLTKLVNRRALDITLEQDWQRAIRFKQAISLMIIDVDHFKKYNDTYGHLKGDQCLKQVANAIAAEINRSTDTVARYGGEEFVVLLPNTRLEQAKLVAEKITKAVFDLGIEHQHSLHSNRITVSIGVACLIPDCGLINTSFTDIRKSILSSADAALYKAKKSGRNAVICSSVSAD